MDSKTNMSDRNVVDGGNENVMRAPIIGINRHRILTDGKGVTTLVGFYGCPLRCKYCLNLHSIDPNFSPTVMSVEELIEAVKFDSLYFEATGGGICFSGGEPLLYFNFINEFRKKCPEKWKIYVETSLNVPLENLKEIFDSVDGLIIDIKDMDPDIYRLYTGKENSQVIENLKYLGTHKGDPSVTIRIPSIPRFNRYEDIKNSIEKLEDMSFSGGQFNRLTYITSRQDHMEDKVEWENQLLRRGLYYFTVNEGIDNLMPYGKAVCNVLSKVRQSIAERHAVSIDFSDCEHKGNCKGTCPKCDVELTELSNAINSSEIPIELSLEGILENLPKNIRCSLETSYVQSQDHWMTEGMCPRPEIYDHSVGPLQGDIELPSRDIKPLDIETEEKLHRYIIDKYWSGVELPPPPEDILDGLFS